MDRKKLIWIFMTVGGAIGSYIPVLWGASELSFSSIILGTVGGVVGIWLGFKMGN